MLEHGNTLALLEITNNLVPPTGRET